MSFACLKSSTFRLFLFGVGLSLFLLLAAYFFDDSLLALIVGLVLMVISYSLHELGIPGILVSEGYCGFALWCAATPFGYFLVALVWLVFLFGLSKLPWCLRRLWCRFRGC